MRKLQNRRRPASKGKAVRISDAVFELLNKNRGNMSWDALFRRMLGLPNRAGDVRILVEGVLEATTGKFFLKTPDASWRSTEEAAYEVAILAAARAKTKRVNKPLRMRELP